MDAMLAVVVVLRRFNEAPAQGRGIHPGAARRTVRKFLLQ